MGYQGWEYKKALPQTASEAFEWLHKIDRGDADLVIGFTMVPFPGPRGEIRGVTQYFSQCVVIPDCWGTTGATTRLVHELCHVFGAFHVAATDSVMQLGFERTPKTFHFGEPTEQTVELAKDVDFNEGVDSLSAETQAKIREIYRVHHHPLESIDEDPIVAGYRYQARRPGWVGDTERNERMQAIADCPGAAAGNAKPRPRRRSQRQRNTAGQWAEMNDQWRLAPISVLFQSSSPRQKRTKQTNETLICAQAPLMIVSGN